MYWNPFSSIGISRPKRMDVGDCIDIFQGEFLFKAQDFPQNQDEIRFIWTYTQDTIFHAPSRSSRRLCLTH
jgi:hypothetical protein